MNSTASRSPALTESRNAIAQLIRTVRRQGAHVVKLTAALRSSGGTQGYRYLCGGFEFKRAE